MTVILLSLAAAAFFALGSAVQQSAAMSEHPDAALRPRLLWNLVRRPRWLLGQTSDFAGFGLQAFALSMGELVVVQPLLVTTLVFALPIGARVSGQSSGPRELRAAITVAAGLALYLLASRPMPGAGDATPLGWLVVGGVSFVVCLALGTAGLRTHGTRRAALLGAGAGVLLGVASAFTKMIVELPSLHPVDILATPWPWLLGVFGISGMVFAQSAFQAGSLSPALATLVVFEPIAAAAVGVAVLGERFHSGPWAVAGALLGVGLTLLGIFELVNHSRVIRSQHETRAPSPGDPETA